VQELHDHGRIHTNSAKCIRAETAEDAGTLFAKARKQENAMSLVRLLGFTTLSCGCVVGRYRELATNREVSYVEEMGQTCDAHGHRRNHTIQASRVTPAPSRLVQAQAS
jgi:hypothetical protein